MDPFCPESFVAFFLSDLTTTLRSIPGLDPWKVEKVEKLEKISLGPTKFLKVQLVFLKVRFSQGPTRKTNVNFPNFARSQTLRKLPSTWKLSQGPDLFSQGQNFSQDQEIFSR